MWFSKIHARAFGPMKNQHLEFEKGLNIVHGANESGKSSWHAAIAVALCGLRRGAGRTKAEREFEARHRPWDGGEDDVWFVQAGIMLDDGRRIEIDRDLDNRMTNVRRADLGGRQFTDPPINDGSPDGSMLLGLDRETFPMTASVRQASIVADLREPDALQQHLARAAAGSTGGTAAGAIERINGYSREHVGLDRRNSTKPLRAAKNGVESAEEHLRAVKESHREYLALASALQGHRDEAARLTVEKDRAEAQRDFCTAKQESDRLDEAIGKLDGWEQRFSSGDPSRIDLPDLTDLALALGSVESLPELETTQLPSVHTLEAQLRELGPPGSVPCPEVEEVERCVSPLQASDPPEITRPAISRTPIAVGIVGGVTAIVVGAVVEVTYGILLALLALVASVAFSHRARSSMSGPDGDARAARSTALRQLEEWHLPPDPVAAVAEASRRIRARTAHIGLVDQLKRRRMFDAKEAQRRQDHEDAWARLRSVAGEQGVDGSDEEVLQRAEATLADHANIQRQRRDDVVEWGRFQEASEGRTPQQCRDEAVAARTVVDDARQRLVDAGVEPSDAIVGEDQMHDEVVHIEGLLRDVRDEVKKAEGRLMQVDHHSVDVAAAEARLSEAKAELGRVERLAVTLDTTRSFLEKSAENAHQLLAPRLAAEMTPWIPKVTSGRYRRVEVDPGNLDVTLITASGSRRDARLVSRGTTEQVYLVLRLVLAQVLSDAHEPCPVLLDDPTVHADASRKTEILDYLLAASEEHQVILFSQEQDVLDWARNHPAGALRLIELTDPQPA